MICNFVSIIPVTGIFFLKVWRGFYRQIPRFRGSDPKAKRMVTVHGAEWSWSRDPQIPIATCLSEPGDALLSAGRAGGDVPEKHSGPFSLWNATCLFVCGAEHVPSLLGGWPNLKKHRPSLWSQNSCSLFETMRLVVGGELVNQNISNSTFTILPGGFASRAHYIVMWRSSCRTTRRG